MVLLDKRFNKPTIVKCCECGLVKQGIHWVRMDIPLTIDHSHSWCPRCAEKLVEEIRTM